MASQKIWRVEKVYTDTSADIVQKKLEDCLNNFSKDGYQVMQFVQATDYTYIVAVHLVLQNRRITELATQSEGTLQDLIRGLQSSGK